MKQISFEGIGEMAASFATAAGVAAGQVVKVSANGKVGSCAAGDRFCGVALTAQDGHAAVQMGGFATVKVTGAGVTAGLAKLSADGSGGVKLDTAAGREYWVVETDTVAGTAAVLL